MVSVGRSDPAIWHGLGPDVDARACVDEDELLPETAALVCHGGAGTMLASLRAGVPLVVVPQFGDQPAIADAVQASGAGLGLPARPGSHEIRDAVGRLLAEPALRQRAGAIADDITALPDISNAVVLLEEAAASSARS